MNYSKKTWLENIDSCTTMKRLSPTEAFIAYHISQKYGDWTSGEGIYCSKKKLAETFNMGRATVTKAFKKLENLGFLVRDESKGGQGDTFYYDAAMPDLASYNTGMTSENAGDVSREVMGCISTMQGVPSQDAQTTKITTNLTTKVNKEKNKEVKKDSSNSKARENDKNKAEQAPQAASGPSPSNPSDHPKESKTLIEYKDKEKMKFIESQVNRNSVLENKTRVPSQDAPLDKTTETEVSIFFTPQYEKTKLGNTVTNGDANAMDDETEVCDAVTPQAATEISRREVNDFVNKAASSYSMKVRNVFAYEIYSDIKAGKGTMEECAASRGIRKVGVDW